MRNPDSGEPLDDQILQYLELTQKRKDLIHLVTVSGRPGSIALIATIEWLLFKPSTKANEDFYLTCCNWETQPFFIVSFPKKKLARAYKFAEAIGMKLTHGAPMSVRAVNEEIEVNYFPGSILQNGDVNQAMLSIENDADSIVYQNSKRINSEIIACELELLEALKNGARPTLAQIKDYVFGV